MAKWPQIALSPNVAIPSRAAPALGMSKARSARLPLAHDDGQAPTEELTGRPETDEASGEPPEEMTQPGAFAVLGESSFAPGPDTRVRDASALIGALLIGLGIAVLVGWAFDIGWLKSLRPAWEAMKANTATAFLFSGISLLAFRFAGESPHARWAAILAAIVTLSIGSLSLAEYVFRVDFGIDQLLVHDRPGPLPPGRMAPITAFDFMLAGGALLALHSDRPLQRIAVQAFACIVLAFAYAALLGYAVSVSALYQAGAFVAMAAHTAAGQLLLAIGLLSASPDTGIARAFMARDYSGRLLRRLVPLSIAGLTAFAWIRYQAEVFGLLDTEMALILFVIVSIGLLLATAFFATSLVSEREFERTFRDIVDMAPDAMVVTNLGGRVVLANAAMERLFGYSPAELIGGPFGPVSSSQESVASGLLGLHKDGHTFAIEAGSSEVTTLFGPCVVTILRDVSEREMFIAELSRALKVKDTFLASMSHELRTPLTTVIGYAGTLLMKLSGPLTREQEKQISVMRSSAKHLLLMINDLLDLAQVESGTIRLNRESLVCQDVAEGLANRFKEFAEAKGLRFELDLPDQPMGVYADRRVLEQVLGNFLKNAITFTQEGFVRISVSANGAVRFNVADSGVGIAEEDRDKVFTAFARLTTERNPEEGTGLGLHLSQKLAHLIGGEISFESEQGKGSTFTLSLGRQAHGHTNTQHDA